MKKIVGLLLVLVILPINNGEGCGEQVVKFQFCFTANNVTILIGENIPCGCNLIFDGSGKNYLCPAVTTTTEFTTIESTTNNASTTTTEMPTTTQSTTTIATTTAYSIPDCEAVGSGNFAAELCYQYYNCWKLLFWWTRELKSCNPGDAFNATSQSCVADPSCVH